MQNERQDATPPTNIVYRTCPTPNCRTFIQYRLYFGGAIAAPGFCPVCAERGELPVQSPIDQTEHAAIAALLAHPHVVLFARPRRVQAPRRSSNARRAAS
jgi:hypothetical protein